MSSRAAMLSVAFILAFWSTSRAEDISGRVKKAVERGTLDQPGTQPFHLKAELAPSQARDNDSGRTGEVEIWWMAPDKWRREVRSPEFHQIEIVDGSKDWQKNEGDYFPEWLREIAVALIRPVPNLDELLKHIQGAEVKDMMGSTYASWHTIGTDGTVSKSIGAGFAITDATGLEFYGGDVGWDGMFHDYKGFHNRMVARTVSAGSPEVTAKIALLEDLKDPAPSLFDTTSSPSSPLLHSAIVEEAVLRKNLVSAPSPAWPRLENGPLEGASISDVVIDRNGKAQEIGSVVTDNPGVSQAVRDEIRAMQFKPYLVDGTPVQVVSTITLPFKTTRPAGTESFLSAKSYFEKARALSIPSSGYVLKTAFTAGVSGGLASGTSTTTWLSGTQWRQEATLGDSKVVRTRNGDKRYLLDEGPNVPLIRIALSAIDPIPYSSDVIESDWRIKRDTVDGISTIRVARGYEAPDGTPDRQQFNGYWFDNSGQLVKSYQIGLEIKRYEPENFNGTNTAHRIDVLANGKIGMRIQVTSVEPSGQPDPAIFVLQGHEQSGQLGPAR